MKISLSGFFVASCAFAIVQLAGAADEKPALKEGKDKVSYSIGLSIGSNLKRSGYEVDVDVLAGAIKDVLAGGETKLNEAQAREVLGAYQKELTTKREDERKKVAEKNRSAGETFLAENKKKAGIKTHAVTLADGATAEMQYKIITEGTGAMPKSNDMVSVNYRGTLIDGKEFDSSAKRGQPGKFQVNRVVRGWTEALQLMKTGSKWEIYLPASLGYGDFGSGPNIEPGAALIFEVELVGIETPQPLTSDIIRVPSAEELKAGAKVEVIKPEDIEKAKAEAEKKEKEKAAKKP